MILSFSTLYPTKNKIPTVFEICHTTAIQQKFPAQEWIELSNKALKILKFSCISGVGLHTPILNNVRDLMCLIGA